MRILWRLLLFVSLLIPLYGRQSLIRTVGNKPALFHPQYEVGSFWQNILRDIYEPLISLDNEGRRILGQASDYTIDANGTRYRFTLRNDIRWSDGTAVTAEDFVYSFRNAFTHPDTHFEWFIAQLPIKQSLQIQQGKASIETLGIHAIDSHHLEILLEYPFPSLLTALSHISLSPLPHHQAADPWPCPEKIISNGPYRITRATEEFFVLEKNPYYYDKERIKIDSVTYWISDEESQTYQKYRKNEIDYLNEIPKNHFKQILKEIPSEVHTFPIFGTYYLSLNMQIPPMNDLKVRKALGYAINREKLAHEVMGSGEQPIYTFIPPGMNGYKAWKPEYQKWSQSLREERAITLLQDAGYTPQHPLAFQLLTNTNEQNRRAMLAVISMWKQVFGKRIHVQLRVLPWDQYQKEKSSIPAVRTGWVADYDNPATMFVVLSRGHIYNISAYNNPRYDVLLQQAERTQNPQIRSRLYRQLEEMILESWPIIPLFQYATARLIKPWVHGYPRHSPLDIIQSRYLYRDTPGPKQ